MKQALITGGARGIGWGVAEAMLAAGYAVTVTGLTEEEVAAVPRCDHLTAIRLDVTDDAGVTALIGGLSRLDALVNCAGMILREGKEFDHRGLSESDRRQSHRHHAHVRRPPSRCWKSRAGAIVNTASMLVFLRRRR